MKIEIKLRYDKDLRKWKDIPARAIGVKDAIEAEIIALALLVDPVKEVRWNIQGSQQGHCVS